MLHEEGNTSNLFVRPDGHTLCIQVGNTVYFTAVYKETPHDTFNSKIFNVPDVLTAHACSA